MKKWKCKKSEIVYDSKYFRVRKDLVELPNGELKEWTYWDSVDSILIIGRTKSGKMVMIKQFRYLTNAVEIEFPAGYCKKGESVKEGAKREFEEETGYKIGPALIKLGAFWETYGQLNRRIHLFFADNVEKIDKKKQESEDDVYEETQVQLVGFNKAVEWAVKNKITATPVALAILLLKEKLKNKKFKN